MPRPAGLPKTGGRKPGSMNKATADIKAAASVYSEQALQVLANIATQGESESARVAAANAILDRAHGKPKQSMDVDANVKAVVTKIERKLVRPSDSHS